MTVRHAAILTDVTRCIGCEQCVLACQKENALPEERPWPWLRKIDDLSSARWTTIRTVQDGDRDHYVRRQCRHCLEPECVSVCIVGALQKTEAGPVVYDRDICIGCRYCMIACPWEIPRYSWEDAVPYVQKCDLCFDRVAAGGQPACTAACPTGATVFGNREELLAEARRRLRAEPDRYVDRIFGEHEVGGTSVLYISDIDLNLTDLAQSITTTDPMPQRTTKILHQMPAVFLGMATVMGGLHWIIRRREMLSEVSPENQKDDANPAAEPAPGQPSDDEPEEK